ncbi:MAG: YfhO family protein [Tepidisphaeraceae bacterium]
MRIGSPRAKSFLAWLAMTIAVAAIYIPSPAPDGSRALISADFSALHVRRIEFAQEALSHGWRNLPAWYPRELMGTPFWSNVQNFPFIPTRLILLPLVAALHVQTAAVMLAGVLAALFTYLYCRQIGVGCVGSATAGWTFATAGFFASRIGAGHLPLLEAYPAMPLLVWLIEVNLREPPTPRIDWRIFALGIGGACVALAGHPQIPIYAIVTASLYLLWRGNQRQILRAGLAMSLGIGVAAFALLPMLLLVARSTRVLPLEPALNDFALPYSRLPALLFPWRRIGDGEFAGNLATAVFYDTVSYVGWLPLVATAVLLTTANGRRALRQRRAWFWVVVGLAALLLALPLWRQIMRQIPGTLLRSPARQIYLTTFALAVVVGLAIDIWLRLFRGRLAIALAGVALAIHVFDEGSHARVFAQAAPRRVEFSADQIAQIRGLVGDGRLGMDFELNNPFNRTMDDVGFFDSIMLGAPYQGLLDLNQAPAGMNVQYLNGADLNHRALSACGVRALVTLRSPKDLSAASEWGVVRLYPLSGAARRAEFFPDSRVEVLPAGDIHRRLREGAFDPGSTLLLRDDQSPTPTPSADNTKTTAVYTRPSPDVIDVQIFVASHGFLRVLESDDTGWSATVDAAPCPILAGNDMFLTVGLSPGSHRVQFRFQTPGARTGMIVSGLSLLGLFALTLRK